MERTHAPQTAVTALATILALASFLPADDAAAADDSVYSMRQGGAWPDDWPKELATFRGLTDKGLRSWTFQRPGEPLVHYGIKFLTREEFETAWPHLLKVKSKGAPIILRSGPSLWLAGAWHGVCIHTPAKGKRPLSEQELKESPWKATNYLELIVDGKIIDFDRMDVPVDTPIIDKRRINADEEDVDEKDADFEETDTTVDVDETETKKRGWRDQRIPDLQATLKSGKETYSVERWDGLDLTLVLTNTSKGEPCEFRSIDSYFCKLDLKLEGPGAQTRQLAQCNESILALRGKLVRLEPGKSYTIPVANLLYGDEYSLHQWRWTRPGEYTLTAAYVIGEVRYEAAPVNLTVAAE